MSTNRSLAIVSLVLLSIVAAVLVGCNKEPEVETMEIAKGNDLQDRALTEQMFGSMRQGGVSPDQPLLWGYFFYGEERGLQKVWVQLQGDGYKLVRLGNVETEPGEEPTSILHVEKVEQHSVDSLLERNKQLTSIASPHGVEYDGMDVGPPNNGN